LSKESYSHVIKYIGLFGSIEFLNIVIAIMRNKFVALILGPQGMGLLSIFNSSTSLMCNATNLGIPISAVKDVSEAYESGDSLRMDRTIRAVRIWSFITAMAGMLICAALSPLLNRFTFTWGDHTLHFVCLSPVIALMAITGGETAILKGTRQLRNLAHISIYNVVAALVTSVPLFYWFGNSGIVPSLLIIATTHMLLTIVASYKLYPLKTTFKRTDIGGGFDMVKLGLAFVIAGIMGSGADFIIRSYLNTNASLDTVGLYNAGYMMTMVYAGMVFSAMETDFYPRLSAVNELRDKRNEVVNNQIEVSLLLISPMLTALMIALPLVLPLLYSSKFIPVMPMMQVTILAMYTRAMKLPMAYITLAKGDSKSYMLLETVYDVMVVILTIVCFRYWGLTGAGVAIATTSAIDIFIVYGYTRYKYDYRISDATIKYFLVHFAIALATLAMVTNVTNDVVYWAAGVVMVTLSTVFSLRILQSKTSLWKKMTERFRRYNGHD